MKNLITALLLIILVLPIQSQTPDRRTLPELGPPPSLKLPTIHHRKLSNGLKVVILEKQSVPVVQLNLVVNTGSAFDPTGMSGLASLTSAMMEEGAGSRNALELADAIDFLGASISSNAGSHTSGVSLYTPLSKLDSALALFADVVLRPTFPESELVRLRKERLTSLLQWHDEPRMISSVLFSKTLFGDKHPYGIPSLGNELSLKSMSVDQIKQFYNSYFRPNNAALIVVGDLSVGTILPKLEGLFGKWKPGKIPVKTFDQANQVATRQIFLVDKPGAAQTEVRIGRIGVSRKTEDFYAINVMNTILGGSFASRLNSNLREEHGYTYGAGSSFDFRPLRGAFSAAAAVQTDVTDKALVEFFKELTEISEPISNEELNRAKNYFALKYPGEFQSVSQIAGKLGELVSYDLPDSYFGEYIAKALAVTSGDVSRVAKKYIDPTSVVIVLVGDREKIEKGVASLNLGPIHVLSVEDVLGKPPVIN